MAALSDTESSSNPSLDDPSPFTSPLNATRQTSSRRQSTGESLSSEEILDEKGKEDKLNNPQTQAQLLGGEVDDLSYDDCDDVSYDDCDDGSCGNGDDKEH